jgi:hypothetical protein
MNPMYATQPSPNYTPPGFIVTRQELNDQYQRYIQR